MTEQKPVVWVTQEANHNFSVAEKFGEVRFLAREDLSNIKGSLHNEKLVSHITRNLAGFNHTMDYVVIAGSPYVAALVFLLLGNKGHKTINILRWDNRSFEYIPAAIETRGTCHE